jgi:hypothetical protein
MTASGKENIGRFGQPSFVTSLIHTGSVGCLNWPHTGEASCFWQIEVRQQRLLVVTHRSKASCHDIKTCLYDYVSAKRLER